MRLLPYLFLYNYNIFLLILEEDFRFLPRHRKLDGKSALAKPARIALPAPLLIHHRRLAALGAEIADLQQGLVGGEGRRAYVML